MISLSVTINSIQLFIYRERGCVCARARAFGEEGGLRNYFCTSLIFPLVSLWIGFKRPGVGGGAGLLQDALRLIAKPGTSRKWPGSTSALRRITPPTASEGQACAPPPGHPQSH